MSRKVSIIIPVYNVKKFLVQAMESAVNQDYDNYEVICVDDGSTDGSSDILDVYLKYDFVKVIHKKNTGYGNSMNIGLEASNGEYISILEPDDFISKDTLTSIMSIIEAEGDLDFVKCDFAFVKGEETLKIVPTKIINNNALYGKVLNKKEILELYMGYIAHWTSIYRREFLDKNFIRYNETPGASYQDIGLWFQTLMYAENGYLSDKFYYHYRCDNPASSMNNVGKVYCTCDEYDYIEKIINTYEGQNEIYPYYIRGRFIAVKDTYRRIANQYRKDFLNRVESDFRRIRNEGKLDVSKLNGEDNKLLNQLLESSNALWNEKNNECYKLKTEISKSDSFYIYGAGNLAQFIYRLLDDKEIEKLKGFVVTSSNGEQSIAEKPIYEFCEIPSNINPKIIVGVSEKYLNEVKTYLENNGLNEYFIFKGGIV